MPSIADEWWTTTEVAEYLGIGVKAVNNYLSRRRPIYNPIPLPDRHYGRVAVWRPVRIVEWHATRPGSGNRRPRK